MGCLAGLGLVSLLDSSANFFDPGLPVYYRTKNFSETLAGPAISEMGFSVVAPSGGQVPGTTDTQICPQPGVKMLTTKQLADAKIAGTNLRAGARVFSISNSWVQRIQLAKGYINPRSVFNDPSVVGLYHDGLLFEFASFVHNDMYSTIINWDVICNANELG
jgi:hypothetical protein